MDPLPERWSDEPWPLDEPEVAAFRPANWSDTHDAPPQVADLADEAWQYAVDHGVSLERALVELQHNRHYSSPAPVRTSTTTSFVSVQHDYEYRAFGGSRHGDVMECRPGCDRTLVAVIEPVNWLLNDPDPMVSAFKEEMYVLQEFACPEVDGERVIGRFLVCEGFDADLVVQECEAVFALCQMFSS